LVSSIGIENIKVVDPINQEETRNAIKEGLAQSGPSVIIAQRPCALFKRSNIKPKPALKVDQDKCEGCRACIGLNCPPISWKRA